MPSLDHLELLSNAMIELDEEEALAIVRVLLAAGEVTPLAIVEASQRAMRVIGERYERQEYYLSGMIVAGELFNAVLDLLEPMQLLLPAADPVGTVVLGTVAGDIHDIGKNMFAGALRTFGFSVIDLGVDVSPEDFLDAVKRAHPGVVCLSGLITAGHKSMKSTVELLRADKELAGSVPPIVLGGATIGEEICHWAGADSWSTDAMEGVRICERLTRTALND